MMAPIAPAGWGWPPNYPLGAIDASALPELPLLQQVALRQRPFVVLDALRGLPFQRLVKPRHLMQRYGLADAVARRVLSQLAGKDPALLGRMGSMAMRRACR